MKTYSSNEFRKKVKESIKNSWKQLEKEIKMEKIYITDNKEVYV